MAQKIIKIGSSLGVTVPKALLEKLGLTVSSEVELTYNARHESIEVSPYKKLENKTDSLFSEVKRLIDEHESEFAKLED